MRLSRCWALLAIFPTLAGARTWTVDDDRRPCRGAEFTRIQDAVDAASPGDRIHVCAGLYAESVIVDKPLVLKGSGPGLATLRTGDPDREAVVRPPAGSDGFTLTAGPSEVSFFTVWSQQAGVLPDTGIRTGPHSSGDAIERNAIWDFQNGVELQSDNVEGQRVVENAIRGPPGTTFNGVFAIHLIGIREKTLVAHNVVRHYRIAITADPGGTSLTPVRRLEITHNQISDTWDGITLVLSEDSAIAHNRMSVDRGGIDVLESARVTVFRNSIEGTGIEDFGVGGAINLFETSDFVVFGNQVQHFTTPVVFDSAAIRLFQATNGKVQHNLVSDVEGGHGIALDSSSNGNLIKGNMTYRTARDGLLVEAGSTSNTLEENFSFLNGEFDAEDRNRTANLWCRNFCQTDNPPGTICMQTDPGCH
jgi:nitrous oxidase accessory protein NosD